MKNVKTVEEYISIYPKNVQEILQRVRQTIKESAPEAEEVISYQLPAYKLNGNLVYFGAFRDHIGFFPTSSAREFFREELSKYKGGKGTIQFPLDKPIPYSVIRKIVMHRVRENQKKGKGNQKKTMKSKPTVK